MFCMSCCGGVNFWSNKQTGEAYLITSPKMSGFNDGICMRSTPRSTSGDRWRSIRWGRESWRLDILGLSRWRGHLGLARSWHVSVFVGILVELCDSFFYVRSALSRTSIRLLDKVLTFHTCKNNNAFPSLASGANAMKLATSSSEGVILR